MSSDINNCMVFSHMDVSVTTKNESKKLDRLLSLINTPLSSSYLGVTVVPGAKEFGSFIFYSSRFKLIIN